MVGNVVRAFVGSALFLSSAAALADAPADTKAAPTQVAAADKVRCKRYVETGSLAKVRKECHTAAEWQQMFESGRAGARDMMDRQSTGGTLPQ